MLPRVDLKVRVHGRHPWFYRKMIVRPATRLPAGSAVHVRDRTGAPVGTGFYNGRTELALRLLTHETIDDVGALLLARLDEARALREDVLGLPAVTDAYRLVHSEGDGFPGLVLDRLGDTIVAQVFSLCMMQRLEPIGEHLLARARGTRLVLTADAEAARREGFERPPPAARRETEITEHGVRFVVQPGSGHKTGFFADQRDMRQLVRRLARGRSVLDLFCNSGGFSLAAMRGGARRALAVDLDEEAVAQVRTNAQRNALRVDAAHGDAFDVLREIDAGAHDLIVLDPPKWARGRGEVDAALARYGDLNRLALEKAAPGALLLTCSCSGAVGEPRFLRVVEEAAAAAARDARVLGVFGAGPDHPVAVECPETRYLKAVLLQIRA
jgi:23S rRNA (cytosine1962-C5)-methyltransferase